MGRVGLIANYEKEKIPRILNRICNFLEDRGEEYLLDDTSAGVLDRKVPSLPYHELSGEVKIVIVLGGDGTLLKAARNFAGAETAILGINLGRLGFLTDVEVDKLETSLEKLLDGEYQIEDRTMLTGEVIRGGEVIKKVTALNDVVINKGNFSRLIKLKAAVDDEYLTTYPADGLIVSSPTGSTAYSLSAGGPIVSPKLDALVLTPICPHTLYSRSIVVRGDEEIKIQVEADHRNIMLTVDGQENIKIHPGDIVKIDRSNLVTHLIKLEGYNFYRILRSRLKENEF